MRILEGIIQKTLTGEKEIAMETYGIKRMVVGEETMTMTKKTITMTEIDLLEDPGVQIGVWLIGGREEGLIED